MVEESCHYTANFCDSMCKGTLKTMHREYLHPDTSEFHLTDLSLCFQLILIT